MKYYMTKLTFNDLGLKESLVKRMTVDVMINMINVMINMINVMMKKMILNVNAIVNVKKLKKNVNHVKLYLMYVFQILVEKNVVMEYLQLSQQEMLAQ